MLGRQVLVPPFVIADLIAVALLDTWTITRENDKIIGPGECK